VLTSPIIPGAELVEISNSFDIYTTEVSSVHGHVIRDIHLPCVLSVFSINIASHLWVLQTYFLIRLIQRPPVKFATSNAESSAISTQGQYLH